MDEWYHGVIEDFEELNEEENRHVSRDCQRPTRSVFRDYQWLTILQLIFLVCGPHPSTLERNRALTPKIAAKNR